MIGGGAVTAACEEATGTVFRLTFKNPWPVSFGEIELSSAAKAHFAEAKAGRLRSRGHGAETRHHEAYPGPDRHRPLAPELVVARDAVRDLTKLMAADGRLKWDVPAGPLAHPAASGSRATATTSRPPPPEGRGLECDKLDPAVVRFHLDQYVGKLLQRAGPAAGQDVGGGGDRQLGVRHPELDGRVRAAVPRARSATICCRCCRRCSKAGSWTTPIVTERMLWDWRRFLADQFSEIYFAEAAKYLQAKGLTYVGESTGRQQYLYDVAYIRNSDVPMGEFWLDPGPGQGVRVDNKVASSIAHIAGKQIVASESYTVQPAASRGGRIIRSPSSRRATARSAPA